MNIQENLSCRFGNTSIPEETFYFAHIQEIKLQLLSYRSINILLGKNPYEYKDLLKCYGIKCVLISNRVVSNC